MVQRVHVAVRACFEVAGKEAYASLPVVEGNAHFVVAGRQGADVDFAVQADETPWADADVALGNAHPGVQVNDMHREGVDVEGSFVNAVYCSLQTH